MEQVTTLFPPAFPALALAHFMALLSPGPDFFLLVGYAMRYRLRGSIGLSFGIAAGNGLYILLAVTGSGLLRQAPFLFTAIELSGAAWLIWLGYQLLKSHARPLAWQQSSPVLPYMGKQLLLGLGSALLNPKNALFYLALMAAIAGPSVTTAQLAACGVWMTCVVLLWDLLLLVLAAQEQIQRRLGNLVWKIERTAGCILMGFGGWILWRFMVG